MAEQNTVGMQSYLNNSGSTISQYRVAVLDTTTEDAMTLPAAANAGNIVGVTIADIADATSGAVVFSGIAYCTAAAAISLGDTVVINDTVGKIKSKAAGASTCPDSPSLGEPDYRDRGIGSCGGEAALLRVAGSNGGAASWGRG